MTRRTHLRGQQVRSGEALLPNNFPERLLGLKERSGMTWEAMAFALGVDTRQLWRWRHGASPSGGAMLSLVRLASQVPGGLSDLLGEELTVVRRRKRGTQ